MITIKHSLVAILAIVLFLMLVINPTKTASNTDLSEKMNLIKMNVLKIYNEQKYELIKETYSENYVLHYTSYPEDIKGHDGLLKFLETDAKQFSDFTLKLDKAYQAGDILFNIWEAEGTNTGPIDNKPATGNKFHIWGISATKVVDGKVVEEWIAFNQLDMINQIYPHEAKSSTL